MPATDGRLFAGEQQSPASAGSPRRLGGAVEPTGQAEQHPVTNMPSPDLLPHPAFDQLKRSDGTILPTGQFLCSFRERAVFVAWDHSAQQSWCALGHAGGCGQYLLSATTCGELPFRNDPGHRAAKASSPQTSAAPVAATAGHTTLARVRNGPSADANVPGVSANEPSITGAAAKPSIHGRERSRAHHARGDRQQPGHLSARPRTPTTPPCTPAGPPTTAQLRKRPSTDGNDTSLARRRRCNEPRLRNRPSTDAKGAGLGSRGCNKGARPRMVLSPHRGVRRTHRDPVRIVGSLPPLTE